MVKVKDKIMYFLVSAFPLPLALATSNVADTCTQDNASCDLDLGSRLNQIFLVNAFPPKPLDIATLNHAGKYAIYCICDVVPSTEV